MWSSNINNIIRARVCVYETRLAQYLCGFVNNLTHSTPKMYACMGL